MAIESLVSISSASMFAMRTTISSTSQNSYLKGNTLAGPWVGLDRFGEFTWLWATADRAESVALMSSCELRRFAGESGLPAGCTNSGLFGEMLGSEGGSSAADCGGGIVSFAIVLFTVVAPTIAAAERGG